MIKISKNKSLLSNNTFGIDATAQYYAEWADEDDLIQLLRWKQTHAPTLPLLNIGKGSNLLFATTSYDGVVATPLYSKPSLSTIQGNKICAKAGVVMDELIEYCTKCGLYGLENLSWIPGTVGASAVQNIGAYGVEVSQFIEKVDCIDSLTQEKRSFNHDECNYSYRDSIFKHQRKWIVTSVTFKLSESFKPVLSYGNLSTEFAVISPTAQLVRSAIIDIRKQKLPDPKVEGNAGSFFMNPIVDVQTFKGLCNNWSDIPHYATNDGHVKLSAAWLIEKSGWKGKSLGHAAVSSKHSLILINKGGAKGEDIVALCTAIQKSVNRLFAIELHPEVNFIY